MSVRRLVSSDAAAYQALRLSALQDCPTAFSSSYEEEAATPLATIAGHMAPDSGRNRFGAFVDGELVGVVGVGRESARKLLHKGFIRGMYVAPGHRGKGLSRQLMAQAMDCVQAMPGVLQVNLSVTGGNETALALYQSCGFAVYGQERGAMLVDGLPYDEIFMVRRL